MVAVLGPSRGGYIQKRGPLLVDTNRAFSQSGQNTDTTATKPLQIGYLTQSGDGDAQQNANTSEHVQGTSECPKSATEVLQECADPDLALIQDRWTKLPEHVKAAVLALVRSTSGVEESR